MEGNLTSNGTIKSNKMDKSDNNINEAATSSHDMKSKASRKSRIFKKQQKQFSTKLNNLSGDISTALLMQQS